MSTYRFKQWADGPVDNPRTINISKDTTLEAVYEEITNLAKMTFEGTVTPPYPGEAVGIAVKLLDDTTDLLTTAIQEDGSYSIEKDYVAGTGYVAQAVVAETVEHFAGSSDLVEFDVGKQPLTVTLNVSPS